MNSPFKPVVVVAITNCLFRFSFTLSESSDQTSGWSKTRTVTPRFTLPMPTTRPETLLIVVSNFVVSWMRAARQVEAQSTQRISTIRHRIWWPFLGWRGRDIRKLCLCLAASSRPRRLHPHRVLVRRRPVNRRQRHIIQAQINSQLRSVMNQVVHHESAQHGDLRQREQRLPAGDERPRLHQLLVARARNRRASRCHALVEFFEELLPRSHLQRHLLRRAAGRMDFKRVQQDRFFRPAGNFRHVTRQPPERHGFHVRLEVRLSFRHALQRFSRAGHFVIELRQNRVSYRHLFLPIYWCGLSFSTTCANNRIGCTNPAQGSIQILFATLSIAPVLVADVFFLCVLGASAASSFRAARRPAISLVARPGSAESCSLIGNQV